VIAEYACGVPDETLVAWSRRRMEELKRRVLRFLMMRKQPRRFRGHDTLLTDFVTPQMRVSAKGRLSKPFLGTVRRGFRR
jgi:hypothetical protein